MNGMTSENITLKIIKNVSSKTSRKATQSLSIVVINAICQNDTSSVCNSKNALITRFSEQRIKNNQLYGIQENLI
jgi:hypothetical protein